MSYNISRSKYINGKLQINTIAAEQLYEKYGDNLPEINFLNYIHNDIKRRKAVLGSNVEIEPFRWSGDLSGFYYPNLLQILKETKGIAQILFVWENGDSFTGLKIDNGEVTKCSVDFILKDKDER